MCTQSIHIGNLDPLSFNSNHSYSQMTTINELRLGWIGLGSMGLAMALNMQRYLEEHNLAALKYHNRTMSRGDPLKELGAAPCSLEILVRQSDVIFISVMRLRFSSSAFRVQLSANRLHHEQVSDDQALHSVADRILGSGGTITGKIFVDTTTLHPSTTAFTTAGITAAGATWIAAPVFGATPVARTGQLLVAVAGPAPAVTLISPFLESAIARRVLTAGDEPAQALLLKTTSNFIGAGLMYLLSEAHTLAEKASLPASGLEALVEHNFGAYARHVLSGRGPGAGFGLGARDEGCGARAEHCGGCRGAVEGG